MVHRRWLYTTRASNERKVDKGREKWEKRFEVCVRRESRKRRTINQNRTLCRSVSLESEQTWSTCTSSHIKREYITSRAELGVLRYCRFLSTVNNGQCTCKGEQYCPLEHFGASKATSRHRNVLLRAHASNDRFKRLYE